MHLNHTMFPLRAMRSTSRRAVPSSLLRTFASTAVYSRTPSLSDITPEGVETFDTNQREFRQKLAAQQKRKDASQFRTASSPAPNAPIASNASSHSQFNSATSSSHSVYSTEP